MRKHKNSTRHAGQTVGVVAMLMLGGIEALAQSSGGGTPPAGAPPPESPTLDLKVTFPIKWRECSISAMPVHTVCVR
jgi:hypothetical protein